MEVTAISSFDTEGQHSVFERVFGESDLERWSFHDTKDPLIRYLRDRRIKIGVQRVCQIAGVEPSEWKALVVCGGVGGEGSLLLNLGFASVTVSDFSNSALEICQMRDPRLNTLCLNAESLDLGDASFDLVLVQDGLHHLRRPVLGLTEMLRVARKGAIVVEPHTGIVADLFGTVWEEQEGEVNFVFRWNQCILEQSVRSYLLRGPCYVKAMRIWDHNVVMRKISKRLGGKRLAPLVAKTAYRILDSTVPFLGNMMVGVIVKG